MAVSNALVPSTNTFYFTYEGRQIDIPEDVAIHIFKEFSEKETLAVLSCISKYWQKLSTCDPLWGHFFERIQSSTSRLLNHPNTFDLFLGNKNNIFQFYLPKIIDEESLYQCMLRNTSTIKTIEILKDLENDQDIIKTFKDLVDSCELGIPKLRVYKSLKDSFTFAIALLIGKSQQHTSHLQADISFCNFPKERGTIWDENKPPHLSTPAGYTMGIKEYCVSFHIYHWYAPEQYFFSNFLNFFNTSKIRELFANRIDSLIQNTLTEKKTI